MFGTARFKLQPAVAGERGEAKFEHEFGAPARPLPFAFDCLETLEKAADIHQEAGEIRTHRSQCLVGALAASSTIAE